MIKTKRNQKWKIPHTLLETRNMCFSSYKNHELKVKLLWVGARERKNTAFFVSFILSEGNFSNIYVLSQRIVYWINFQNIYTFKYQRILLRTLFCMILKSSKVFLQLNRAHCTKSVTKSAVSWSHLLKKSLMEKFIFSVVASLLKYVLPFSRHQALKR